MRFIKPVLYEVEFMKFDNGKPVKDIIKVVHLGGKVNKDIIMIFCTT